MFTYRPDPARLIRNKRQYAVSHLPGTLSRNSPTPSDLSYAENYGLTAPPLSKMPKRADTVVSSYGGGQDNVAIPNAFSPQQQLASFPFLSMNSPISSAGSPAAASSAPPPPPLSENELRGYSSPAPPPSVVDPGRSYGDMPNGQPSPYSPVPSTVQQQWESTYRDPATVISPPISLGTFTLGLLEEQVPRLFIN